VERQKKVFEDTYGKDEEGEEEESNEEQEVVVIVNGKPVVQVPDWLRPPLAFYSWGTNQQNDFVRLRIKVYNKHRQIEKKAELQKRRLKRLEEKSYLQWVDRFRVSETAEMESELEMMEATEVRYS
jgi:hypothetical protein